MVYITDEQKNILAVYLDNFNELIKSNDVNDLLDELDDLITDIGFDENYELTEEGLKLQLLYDQIYNQN